jgi:putative ATP-dependent endonuclease of the OLD family
MFMAMFDWDRQVTLSLAEKGETLPPTIRGYDEPDTNLDYKAQRFLYRSITQIVEGENSNIQAIICTHSPRLIDRAPAQSIRLLNRYSDSTSIEKLSTDDDKEVELFLSSLAAEMGLTNTLMFYENCFILVEGETEENALPCLYRTLYHHSMLEDGIRIINVNGNGSFREIFKFLSKNKQTNTIALIDCDSERTREAKLTNRAIMEAGFSQEFIQDRVIYIGAPTEFEDAFCNETIVQCLNSKWPKEDSQWIEDEINSMRGEGTKFSNVLGKGYINLRERYRFLGKTRIW